MRRFYYSCTNVFPDVFHMGAETLQGKACLSSRGNELQGCRNESSFHPESALFRPGAVGPPARISTLREAGGTGRISTLREAVPMYASAQTLDFLTPFGAALGNPEMTGHQNVRARAKNAFFPNGNLAGRGICPGVSGWIRVSFPIKCLRRQTALEGF